MANKQIVIDESNPSMGNVQVTAGDSLTVKLAGSDAVKPDYNKLTSIFRNLSELGARLDVWITETSRVNEVAFLPDVGSLRIVNGQRIDLSGIHRVNMLLLGKHSRVESFAPLLRAHVKALECNIHNDREMGLVSSLESLQSLRIVAFKSSEIRWSRPIEQLAFESCGMRCLKVDTDSIGIVNLIKCSRLERIECKGANAVLVNNCKHLDLGGESQIRCAHLCVYGLHATRRLKGLVHAPLHRLQLSAPNDGYEDLREAFEDAVDVKSVFLEGLDGNMLFELAQRSPNIAFSNGIEAYRGNIRLSVDQFFVNADTLAK